MNTTHFSSAVAEMPLDSLARQFFLLRPLSGTQDAQVAARPDRRAIVSGGISIPSFLTNRIGQVWTNILQELRESVGTDVEYHRLVHGMMAFVETSAVGAADQPRHGTGLLAGLPLTVGWRRRLYVCPTGGQLKWIPSPARAKEPLAG